MKGGSWMNNISWVLGYDDVLIPMEPASALFHERVLAEGPRHQWPALPQDHLLTAQTSCYRYWGGGVWTDYGAEIARRASDIVTCDF
jgi:hypothetical protein